MLWSAGKIERLDRFLWRQQTHCVGSTQGSNRLVASRGLRNGPVLEVIWIMSIYPYGI